MAASNSINETTTGICGFTGTAFTSTPATQYQVQIGGATSSTLAGVTNGTTGQFLGANTGAAPTFQTVSAKYVSGVTDGTSPTAGYIGEQLRGSIDINSPITLSDNVVDNITSVSLTAGIWDVSALGCNTNGPLTGLQWAIGISATSATFGGTDGISLSQTPTVAGSNSDSCLSIPNYRININSTITYYLVCKCQFTIGTAKAYGSIIATRVG